MEAGYCYGCMERIGTYPCPRCAYTPANTKTSYTLQPGTILNGKYLVGRVLGQGGFGITYIGMDLQLQRKVAIKEYYPVGFVGRKTDSGSVVWYAGEAAQEAKRTGQEMVLREARKMSRVEDIDTIVKVFTVFRENETSYICMDFVDGQTLQQQIIKTGPLTWEAAGAIFLPVIQSMDQVHRCGLIHRDLSPDNLMLQRDGSVKILDLGAAKDLKLNSGKSSVQVAKSGFSPLELYVQTGHSGSWTDVYAMAATMYYALTGILPPSAIQRMDADTLRWDLPQLQQLPPEVCSALRHAMAIHSGDRIQTMADFLQELQSKPRKEPNRQKRRIPAAVPVAAAAAVAAIAVFLGISFGKDPPKGPGSYSRTATLAQHQAQIDALIDSCTMESYQYRNGSRMELYFDGQNNQRLRIFTNEEGKDECIILAEYDAQGNFLEQMSFEGQEMVHRTVWTRDPVGNATYILKYQEGGVLTEQTEIGYDSQGRETSRTTVDGAGRITLQAHSTYDPQGQQTCSGIRGDGGRFVNVYAADGRILEATDTDKDGNPVSRWVYRYDKDGNQTEDLYYDETGQLVTRWEYHYIDSRKAGYNLVSFRDGDVDVHRYTYLLGPRDIAFGQYWESDSHSIATEYVQDISESCCIRDFRYEEGPLATLAYEITYYDWNGDSTGCKGYDSAGNPVSIPETPIVPRSHAWNPDGSHTVHRYDAGGTHPGFVLNGYLEDGSYTLAEQDAY